MLEGNKTKQARLRCFATPKVRGSCSHTHTSCYSTGEKKRKFVAVIKIEKPGVATRFRKINLVNSRFPFTKLGNHGKIYWPPRSTPVSGMQATRPCHPKNAMNFLKSKIVGTGPLHKNDTLQSTSQPTRLFPTSAAFDAIVIPHSLFLFCGYSRATLLTSPIKRGRSTGTFF